VRAAFGEDDIRTGLSTTLRTLSIFARYGATGRTQSQEGLKFIREVHGLGVRHGTFQPVMHLFGAYGLGKPFTFDKVRCAVRCAHLHIVLC